jgi:putative membrane protein
MIEHYSDHAANERTFLAWVRTAIAVMAFGFLVEKFDLFLAIAGQSLERRAGSGGGAWLGNVAGLLLILLGGAMMVLATIRFRRTAVDIDSAEIRPGDGTRMDVVLAGLLVLLGAALFFYLFYTVIARMSGPG